MNRYPLWKYVLIVVAVLLGTLYTAPNQFGEAPAVQISSGKSTLNIERDLMAKVEAQLKQAGIAYDSISYDVIGTQASIRVRFADTKAQFAAKTLLEKGINPDPNDPSYILAYNLVPKTPAFLQTIRARPMHLGLDLRGGVHFLMQVDTKAVVKKRIAGIAGSAKGYLRDEHLRYASFDLHDQNFDIALRDDETRSKVRNLLLGKIPELQLIDSSVNGEFHLTGSLKAKDLADAVDNAVQQNIVTLSKRVNELDVSEPVIQRQGNDRIVVELPGVQDVAHAKDILGRTATLEARLVDESVVRHTESPTNVPPGSEYFGTGREAPVIAYKDPIITGEYIISADARPDSQTNQPSVEISLSSEGGRRMYDGTKGKIGKLMTMILFEKGKGEVLTVATLQAELGSQFRITGQPSMQAANDLALLLRAGSLAAPMTIIEERTVGPQLGAQNIAQGFNSTMYGFAAIAIFMVVYYMMFGVFSVMALAVNLLLLVGILSGIQATLTLPGMAAIALALGMAIDANVLINERIREELRAGNPPQTAIALGFERAWATILDSNVTTLIVGIALIAFGSGPVRGFAVVHCLGIISSIFSSVFVSRGAVNLWYGRRKKLTSVKIGQVWKPAE